MKNGAIGLTHMIVIKSKKILFVTILVFSIKTLFSQSMSVTIELNLILSDSEASKIFIDNHTLLFNPNRIELYKSNHSLSHNNFNRKISKEKNYTFCSIPVLDIYAYKMLNSFNERPNE